MPTTIYTKNPIGSVTHNGISYPVKGGEVSVPDDAVDVLCEAHGFHKDMTAAATEDAPPFDIAALSKVQLIEIGVKLGAELKMSMTKDEIFAIVAPLHAAEAAKAA